MDNQILEKLSQACDEAETDHKLADHCVEVRIKERLNQYKSASSQADNVTPYWLNPFSYGAYFRKRWLSAAKRAEADQLEKRLMLHLEAQATIPHDLKLDTDKMCVDAYWTHEAGNRLRKALEEEERLNAASWLPWNKGRHGLFHEALQDCLSIVEQDLEPTRDTLVNKKARKPRV